ncbi:hypothetical protein TNCV_1761211 [Trichonephila clavipes]|nr:hypothetical protein TNCV_1761211 [Trichonephila clavipes]
MSQSGILYVSSRLSEDQPRKKEIQSCKTILDDIDNFIAHLDGAPTTLVGLNARLSRLTSLSFTNGLDES